MDSKKCACVCVCFVVVIISMVQAMPNLEKQVTSLKCLRMGSTKFKLCIDEIDNFSEESDPSWNVQKRHWGDDLSPRMPMSASSPSYNRRMFTDYGGMVVPFFMKKRSSHKSDVPFQSIFPFKMADSVENESKSVNKRPFDSISYNTGLGGFK